jgi:hypothetical protein
MQADHYINVPFSKKDYDAIQKLANNEETSKGKMVRRLALEAMLARKSKLEVSSK